MAKAEKSIYIDAPVAAVWAYLEDPRKNPEWLPGLEEIKNVRGEGLDTRIRWAYRTAAIPLEGETVVLELAPNERMVTRSQGGIESTWRWTFAPEEGGTRLGLTVDYTVPLPVLGKLAEAVAVRQTDGNLDTAMANIKAAVES